VFLLQVLAIKSELDAAVKYLQKAATLDPEEKVRGHGMEARRGRKARRWGVGRRGERRIKEGGGTERSMKEGRNRKQGETERREGVGRKDRVGRRGEFRRRGCCRLKLNVRMMSF